MTKQELATLPEVPSKSATFAAKMAFQEPFIKVAPDYNDFLLYSCQKSVDAILPHQIR